MVGEQVDHHDADEFGEVVPRVRSRLERATVEGDPVGIRPVAGPGLVAPELDLRLGPRRWDVLDGQHDALEVGTQRHGKFGERVDGEALEAGPVPRTVPVDGPASTVGVGAAVARVAIVPHRGDGSGPPPSPTAGPRCGNDNSGLGARAVPKTPDRRRRCLPDDTAVV